MKIAIIGAGSVYTPELFEKLAECRDALPVSKVTLMDVDAARLDVMTGFCRRFAKRLGLGLEIEQTTDLDHAVDGCAFVNTQMRVGLNRCRVLDERIPLSMGLVGQETTGAGGFAKALRTVPQMLRVAESVEKYAPDAWIINYTNPTGIVAEAVNKYTRARIAGLCAGGLNAKWLAWSALDADPESVRFDIAGLNHLSFSYNVTVDGRPVNDDEFMAMAQHVGPVDPELIKSIGALPISYLQYYYHTQKKVDELKNAPQTRGEQVLEMEAGIYAAFADEACDDKPELLAQRGGGGYADIAVSVMSALHSGDDLWTVANVPNEGILDFVPRNAVIETPVIVNKSGIRPLAVAPPPVAVRGLIASVKSYELLTVEAAVEGSRDKALLALTHHPLVGDYDTAAKLLPQILEAHREYLPAFFS